MILFDETIEIYKNVIKPLFSPCYGSPFMPRQIREYSDMLMQKVEQNQCNVYLINTGMDKDGKRYPLEYTRQCIKDAIQKGSSDESEIVLGILEGLINA